MNAWKPGQRAMVEVDVIEGDTGDGLVMFGVTTDPPWQVRGSIPADLLLPVSAPDADTIERARKALNTSAVLHDFGGQSDWDETPQHVTCECGEVFEAETVGRAQVIWHEHVIDEQVNVVRDLLAVREPGRSEAEIKAEALREAADVAGDDTDGGGWNYFPQTWSGNVASWLRARAAQGTDTEGGE